MIVHNCEQNSVIWLNLRAGVVTASEIDSLVTPLFKARTGEGVESYLAQKLAEKWFGGPLPQFMDINCEFGHILEEFAIPAFTFETGKQVSRVGFITSDDGTIGCSPDGLIGEDEGIEIKCPTPAVHMKYLLSDEFPKQYAAQVQLSLYLTKRKRWQFVSYHRRMPMLVKTVEPDPKAFAAFDEAVNDFLERMRDGWKKLVDLNGGKEPTRKTFTPAEPITEDYSHGITP